MTTECVQRYRRRTDWRLPPRVATSAASTDTSPLPSVSTVVAAKPSTSYLSLIRATALNSQDRAQMRRRASPNPLALDLVARDASQLRAVARRIAERGFCVCSSAFPPELTAAIAAEAHGLYKAKKMTPAYFGNERNRVESVRRQDHTLWLNHYVAATFRSDARAAGASALARVDEQLATAGKLVLDCLAEPALKHHKLARADDGSALYCTGRTDGMVACYPGGQASYGAHLDNVDRDGREDYGRVL